MRSEAVTEHMPAHLPDAGHPAGSAERVPAITRREHPPVLLREHERTRDGIERSCTDSVVAQRQLTRLTALRCSDDPTHSRATHQESPSHEINVFPTQREQLSWTKTLSASPERIGVAVTGCCGAATITNRANSAGAFARRWTV
jgi:hypothetical protein